MARIYITVSHIYSSARTCTRTALCCFCVEVPASPPRRDNSREMRGAGTACFTMSLSGACTAASMNVVYGRSTTVLTCTNVREMADDGRPDRTGLGCTAVQCTVVYSSVVYCGGAR